MVEPSGIEPLTCSLPAARVQKPNNLLFRDFEFFQRTYITAFSGKPIAFFRILLRKSSPLQSC